MLPKTYLLLLLTLCLLPLASASSISVQAQTGLQVEAIAHLGGKGFPTEFVWSPDGQLLASNVVNGVQLYNSELQTQQYLDGARGFTGALAWSTQGDRIAAAIDRDPALNNAILFNNPNEIVIWNVDSGTINQTLVLPYEDIPLDLEFSVLEQVVELRSISWSPDDRFLAVVARVQLFTIIAVFEVESGTVVATTRTDSFDGTPALLWEADSEGLIYYQQISIQESVLFRWDIENEAQRYSFDGAITAQLTDDRLEVLSAENAFLFESDDFVRQDNPPNLLRPAAVNPDGTWRYAVEGQAVTVSNRETGEVVAEIEHGIQSRFQLSNVQAQWLDEQRLLVIVPVTVGRDTENEQSPFVVVWDAESQSLHFELFIDVVDLNISENLIFSPDGRYLLLPAEPHRLLRLDLEAGELASDVLINTVGILALTVDPTGNRIIQGELHSNSNRNLVWWDLETNSGRLYRVGYGYITGAAWHPVGDLIALGDQSYRYAEQGTTTDRRAAGLSLWSHESDEIIIEDQLLSYALDLVAKPVWNADGSLLAAIQVSNASGINHLIVWNRAGEQLWQMPLTTLAFSWSTDASQLFAFDNNSLITIDAITGTIRSQQEVDNPSRPFEMRTRPIVSNQLAILIQGTDEIQIFDVESATVINSHAAPEGFTINTAVPVLAWSPNGQHLAFSVIDTNRPWQPRIEIWRINETGAFVEQVAVLEDHYQGFIVGALAWVENRIYAIGGHGDLMVWEVNDVQ